MRRPPTYPSREQEMTLLKTYYETGDIRILGQLYEPYMFLVFGVCLKYLKDSAKSEDAVMEIFEELIRKLRIHRVDNFKSWLYTYARNFCLMILRKENRQSEFMDERFMENEPMEHPSNGEDWHENQLQQLEACIETLNDEQKICVRLFFLENKCYKDIAEQTGYDLKKVKSYIQNGKRNIKICMEKSHE